MYDLNYEQSQFVFGPGGILSSGMARIGIDGVAGAFGKAGTPKFKSMSRLFAAAGMLPQGRLAGEHVLSTNHFGMWSNWLVAICFYVIDMNFDWTETIVAQADHEIYWFPHK